MIIYWETLEKSAIDPARIPDYIASDYFTRGFNISPITWDGWLEAKETWTYASATTFTISGDKTGKYQKGDKLKLTQTPVKYFYVVGSSFSTNTTITVTGGSDYTLADAAITSPFYSYAETPQGFPDWFGFTPTYTGFSSNPTITCRFCLKGKTCIYVLSNSTAGTSNATTKTVTAPIAEGNHHQVNTLALVVDDGAWRTWPGHARITQNSATINVYTSIYAGAWVASGNCQFEFIIIYQI